MSQKELSDVWYIMQLIYDSYGIEGYLFQGDGNVLYHSGSSSKNVLQAAEAVYAEISKEKRNQNIPCFLAVENRLSFFWFSEDVGRVYLFGPIADMGVNETDIRRYCHKRHIPANDYVIPACPWIEALGMAGLMCYSLTGRRYTVDNILNGNKNQINVGMEALTQNKQVFYVEQGMVRKSVRDENEYLGKIEQGIFHLSEEEDESKRNRMSNVGILSSAGEKKQLEYMAVSGVVLAARAAMRGGANSVSCYELSDAFLQKLSSTDKVLDYMQIVHQATHAFSKMVWDKKHGKGQDALVERCYDYIASHLFQEFTIQQMAEELAVSRAHLSTRFSQYTGVPLKQYIIKERLNAGLHFLLYSENTVEEIADYLHFSSTSRFCEYFRKEYGETPQKYRSIHKTEAFCSKG